ncbi:hypothetical protein TVAG_430680 [Trichomonas vaginalis G3]|uniref:Nucleoplasmin-like domain-containing protein n=1 Tax=Trichomonas vaginalis (strain ATCC PRA-98 / G3) TaxID=412133 RepID=A2E393_TRIV3|nr:nucleoplasmin-like domain family [Trichomonas vaginalis G3]EAY12903.1 hypothetical protein TVAG_430680 [Trichomonas vaginalis G3]KAI5491926.1 nucleoplasmin-like domain family [Trichomonas vaginalis G3]|eukprot:XP_001325126.1 hypothetical protein [Trichomonas vaginalis G3]
MESFVAEKFWTMTIHSGKPERPPVPKGSRFMLSQIQAVDEKADKILVEMLTEVIRMDKIDDETDTTVTDVAETNIAVIYPKKKSTYATSLVFSEVNDVLFGCDGGDVILSGVYDDTALNEEMAQMEEEEAHEK